MASLATSSPPKSKDVIFRVHPKLTFAKRSIFFDWECPCTESIMSSPCADHFVGNFSLLLLFSPCFGFQPTLFLEQLLLRPFISPSFPHPLFLRSSLFSPHLSFLSLFSLSLCVCVCMCLSVLLCVKCCVHLHVSFASHIPNYCGPNRCFALSACSQYKIIFSPLESTISVQV